MADRTERRLAGKRVVVFERINFKVAGDGAVAVLTFPAQLLISMAMKMVQVWRKHLNATIMAHLAAVSSNNQGEALSTKL